jgi:hypothetical protein
METFHLLHLASCWRSPSVIPVSASPQLTRPVLPTIPVTQNDAVGRQPAIKAAAAQLVFASRSSQEFITPQHVAELEAWTGQAVLDAVSTFEIENHVGLTTSVKTALTHRCSDTSFCILTLIAFGSKSNYLLVYITFVRNYFWRMTREVVELFK